jgi:predicted nucleic acid-binding protein
MNAERRRFGLDTNILIYTIEAGASEKGRRAELIVRRAVATRRCVLAVQNIGEFHAACVRKRRTARDAAAARAGDFGRWPRPWTRRIWPWPRRLGIPPTNQH